MASPSVVSLGAVNPDRIALVALLALVGTILPACGSRATAGSQVDARPVSFECPKRTFPEGALAAKNANPRSREKTVPGGPERLLLCRYWGLNNGSRSSTLASGRPVGTRRAVESIAAEIDALPPFPRGPIACPSDNGARIDATFFYDDEPPVIVEVRLNGCPAALNGRAKAGWLSPRLAHRLENLVPLPR
jgi:hypothetical protein